MASATAPWSSSSDGGLVSTNSGEVAAAAWSSLASTLDSAMRASSTSRSALGAGARPRRGPPRRGGARRGRPGPPPRAGGPGGGARPCRPAPGCGPPGRRSPGAARSSGAPRRCGTPLGLPGLGPATSTPAAAACRAAVILPPVYSGQVPCTLPRSSVSSSSVSRKCGTAAAGTLGCSLRMTSRIGSRSRTTGSSSWTYSARQPTRGHDRARRRRPHLLLLDYPGARREHRLVVGVGLLQRLLDSQLAARATTATTVSRTSVPTTPALIASPPR